jgi:hypothetical protein
MPSKDYCENNYHKDSSAATPLMDVSITYGGNLSKYTWCSTCIFNEARARGEYDQICICGHHKVFHLPPLPEEFESVNKCEGSGSDTLVITKTLRETIEHCKCKGFKPIKKS